MTSIDGSVRREIVSDRKTDSEHGAWSYNYFNSDLTPINHQLIPSIFRLAILIFHGDLHLRQNERLQYVPVFLTSILLPGIFLNNTRPSSIISFRPVSTVEISS